MLKRMILGGAALALLACNDDADPLGPTDADGIDAGDTSGDVPHNDAGIDTTPDTTVDTAPDTTPDVGPPDTTPDVPPADTTPDTPTEPECGNGVREEGELCDGPDLLDGVSCIDQGFLGGVLSCSDTCTFDASTCYDEQCGDDEITGNEECEGDVVGDDVTCASLGFAPGGDGVVTCGECYYDTSTCDDFICGNDNLEADFEACDGDQFGDTTCRTLGFYAGDLSCNDACDTIDDSACVENVCGNGTVEGDEVCDGMGSVAVSCADIVPDGSGGDVFVAGVLGCSDDCFAFDTTNCLLEAPSEEDDSDLDGIIDEDDNCPDTANANQLDIDGDGVGNVCDDAMVLDVLIEGEELNVFHTRATGGDAGSEVTHEFDRVVESASAEATWDDEGVLSVHFVVAFEDSTETVALSSPIPIPGLDSVTMNLSDAGMETVDALLPAGAVESYPTGEFDGANPTFTMNFTATYGGSGSGSVDEDVEVEESNTSLSLYEGELRWTIDDPDLEIGSASVDPGFVGAVDVAIIGLTGELALTFPAPL